jgi:hypothetical protein
MTTKINDDIRKSPSLYSQYYEFNTSPLSNILLSSYNVRQKYVGRCLLVKSESYSYRIRRTLIQTLPSPILDILTVPWTF